MRSSIFPLTVISYIAIVVVADDLFSDFTVTDSNLDAINWDNTPDLSNNLLPNGADTSGQLLAFNDNQDSNPSADVNQFSTDGLFGQSANLIQDNSISLTDSASTNQASTSFLDDGTLDTLVGANPASSNLFDEFDPNGQLPSSDLLAGGTASSCSSFQPSSPSKRRRKRGDLVPREGGEACAINRLQVPKGFIGSSSAAQSKVYNAYVCPTTDFPDALVPVCSSIVVTNNVYILGSAPIFPDSHTLFDSSLLLWNEAYLCAFPRAAWCCGTWTPNIFYETEAGGVPGRPMSSYFMPQPAGTGYNCYQMFRQPNILQWLAPPP